MNAMIEQTYLFAPSSYPYALFKVRLNNHWFYTVGIDRDYLIRKFVVNGNGVVTEPVSVYDYISLFGHKETRKLFKVFGKNWITKNGMVFFANDNKATYSLAVCGT
jgi:hypothetical protein